MGRSLAAATAAPGLRRDQGLVAEADHDGVEAEAAGLGHRHLQRRGLARPPTPGWSARRRPGEPTPAQVDGPDTTQVWSRPAATACSTAQVTSGRPRKEASSLCDGR